MTGGGSRPSARGTVARRLLRDVPDEPRWVETRAMLLEGRARVLTEGGAAIVHCEAEHLASAVGRPPPSLLAAFADAAPRSVELLAQEDDAERIARELLGWTLHPCAIHVHPEPSAVAGPARPVRVFEPGGAGELESLLDGVSGRLRSEVERIARRAPCAVALDRGRAVSFCLAGATTERWCDLSVETLPAHRRRGFARAACSAMIRCVLERGRRPVWGSADANAASRSLAAALGFEPVGRIAVLTPPGSRVDV